MSNLYKIAILLAGAVGMIAVIYLISSKRPPKQRTENSLRQSGLDALASKTRANHDGSEKRSMGRRAGFQDRAVESGIGFRMQFLAKEQGETFKVNLYDHGLGVAVGDYNGDGHDDIYFVNQLGPNALYRNKGDGTFVEVTREAGVALGDRICVAATFADYDNEIGRAHV